MSMLFAATYPERTVALVAYGCSPRDAWAPDFPWGYTREELQQELDDTERGWGSVEYTAQILKEWGAPSVAGDDEFVRWLASYSRMSASPAAAAALSRMNFEIDVRHVLPVIQVPTLILNREGDGPEVARYMADRIPGAKVVVLPGPDHIPWVDEKGEIVAEIERFVREVRDEEAEFDRVLATVMFTDIVGSTERATHLGDRRWRELLEDHNARVRGLLTRYRGREIDTAGDGFLATFDGPARAIPCARAAVESLQAVGIEIRAGLHTGECEMVEDKVRGIAVHTGASVASLAGPGEVLVSSTVKDLVAGSGLEFEDRGSHELKGIPGQWQLFAAVDAVG